MLCCFSKVVLGGRGGWDCMSIMLVDVLKRHLVEQVALNTGMVRNMEDGGGGTTSS